MCYRGGLYIGSNVRSNIKNVLPPLECMSEMNERKYACQSEVAINNGKFHLKDVQRSISWL